MSKQYLGFIDGPDNKRYYIPQIEEAVSASQENLTHITQLSIGPNVDQVVNQINLKGYYFNTFVLDGENTIGTNGHLTILKDWNNPDEEFICPWKTGQIISIFNSSSDLRVATITNIIGRRIEFSLNAKLTNTEWKAPATREFDDNSVYAEQRNADGTYTLVEGEVELAYYSFAFGSNNVIHAAHSMALGKNNLIGAGSGAAAAFGRGNTVLGSGGMAFGYNNKVLGNDGYALGQSNTVNGTAAVAIGASNQAINLYAFAEGHKTIASGARAHSEGEETVASGRAAHAEGYLTQAVGLPDQGKGCSHAEGLGTYANGAGQHAQGKWNIQDDKQKYAHIVGNGNSEDERSNAHTLDWAGNAWFAGEVEDGYGNKLSALANMVPSSLVGQITADSGEIFNDYKNNKASKNAHAEGYQTKATNEAAHAEGRETTASGKHSHAEGLKTNATGNSAHAEGHKTTASGAYSHAEGELTEAIGSDSHAEGYSTTASGKQSHAEGYLTIASENYAHAEGQYTEATGARSHAEGEYTKAQGRSAHAEGYMTVAAGIGSQDTKTGGTHAEGLGTIARGTAVHVQGRWNIEDTTNKYAHIVGNGTADITAQGQAENIQRSNAHTLDWDGNAWYAGNIRIGGTEWNSGKEIATKDYVDNKPNIYTGTSLPDASQYKNGDIFILITE